MDILISSWEYCMLAQACQRAFLPNDKAIYAHKPANSILGNILLYSKELIQKEKRKKLLVWKCS